MTQTSPVCRCAASSRCYQLLSIRSLKLLMIHFMHRIPRVHHVIRSIILPSSSQALQMLPTRIFTAPLQPLYIPTTRHIHPFLPQPVSQGHAHLPPSRIQKKPYQGFWRSEVHVLRLRIRFVRQDLACVYSDGFGSCFLIWVCFINDYRWSTIHTLPKWHMMCAHF
jgi:hypothetical protein